MGGAVATVHVRVSYALPFAVPSPSSAAVCSDMPHVIHMAVAGAALMLYLTMALTNLMAVSKRVMIGRAG